MDTFKKLYDSVPTQPVAETQPHVGTETVPKVQKPLVEKKVVKVFAGSIDELGKVNVEPYLNSRFFAVITSESRELICVCVYKKGAFQVANLLNTLQQRIDILNQTNVIQPAA